ncbi:MAG: DDE-type integrase/transposase/recombinase [Dehalococcoidales bacterium]|jgi:transposase-like protein
MIDCCKYCQSQNVIKYGKYGDTQLYYCKKCGSKFKDDDTTFHMKTDANEISSALNMYFEGMSVKAIRRHLLQEHNHAPSTATIYEWIQKYTQYATDSIKDYHPNVGDIWIADETVLKIGGSDLWLWDIIDDKTRYLLATRLSRSRTTRDAQILIDRAIKTAGKSPKAVVTDKLNSYLDVSYGKGAEHVQGGIARAGEDNTQKIERFHGTLKARTKVMRGLKNFETALDFTEGWLAHYNYLRPHESLQDKTPAEMAGIDYPYKNWADIIRKHEPSKPVTIEHQPRDIAIEPTHIGRKHKRIRPSKRQAKASPTTLASMRLK